MMHNFSTAARESSASTASRPLPPRSTNVSALLRLTRPFSGRESPTLRLPTQLDDWAELMDLAGSTHLLPLLAWRLKEHPGVPDAVGRQLAHAFHANNARNLVRVSEMRHIFKILEAHQIPALALKGPALARLCYQTLGMRVFQDIDLLVPTHCTERAIQLMLDRGYRHWLPEWTERELAGLFSRPDYLRFLWRDHAMMVRDDPRMTIEVHWEASPAYYSFPLPFQDLWKNRQSVEISGQLLPTLSDQDTLLLLAAHGSKHSWQELKLTCDLAWAIQAFADLDWNALRERATRLGGIRMLRVGCQLSCRLFGTPPNVTEPVGNDSTSRHLARQIQDRLLGTLEGDARACDSDHHQALKIEIRERFRDRVRMTLRFLFTPSTRDWRWVPLPPLLFPLYRLLRPIRLAWQRLTNPSDSSLHSD